MQLLSGAHDNVVQQPHKQTPSISQQLQNLFNYETEIISKTSSKICQTIVEIQATRKLYHIRQNFRKLALSILQLQNAEFYVFHDSGRIQFHDFRENYITQLLEENQKRKIIQHLLANTSSAVENIEIRKLAKEFKSHQTFKQSEGYKKVEQFNKLFSMKNETHKQIGQINKENEKYSILSLFTNQKYSSTLEISEKIVQKLILISMIEIEEETEYDIVQFYSKELLDILGLIVGESQQQMKRTLKQRSKKETQLSAEQISLNDVIRKFFSPSETSYLLSELIRYQEHRYELLERIRMYSKYLCEDNMIFMDFDELGSLSFLSNNRKNSQLQPLLAKLSLTNSLCIEKIFEDNITLQQHIKKSLQGQSKNKKLYELENGIKARVIRNEDKEIERIIIVVEDPPIISSQSSFSSSTFEGISAIKKKGSCDSDSISLGKDKRSTGSLIKSIEKQNPGMVAENGWLNLFIKDHELKRNHSNIMTKKKQTLFAKSEEDSKSSSSLTQLISADIFQQLKSVDIFSPETNLLSLQLSCMQPLVKKVFSQLKFFKSFEYNKDYFDNFLFHLQEGYSLYDNPFHNFMHGVNVMHTCFLICNIPGNQQILSPLKVFSTVLSGLCHDVGHTGRTNSFEIASRSKKALTYNDLSPLQNFHASFTFEILRRPENNFLQKLSLQDFNEIRKDIISNILYTDIKEHFPLIKKFKAIEFNPSKPMNPQDLRTLTGMITHTSDFGGSAKEFQICKEWSRRVNIEFSSQYNQEELLGLPQTPFFKDLDVQSIMAKNQMGFLKVIVFPLYEALDQFYKEESALRKLKVYAQQNIKEWEKVHLDSLNSNNNHTKDQAKN